MRQNDLAHPHALGIVVIFITVAMIATIIIVEDVRGLAALFDVMLLASACNFPFDRPRSGSLGDEA